MCHWTSLHCVYMLDLVIVPTALNLFMASSRRAAMAENPGTSSYWLMRFTCATVDTSVTVSCIQESALQHLTNSLHRNGTISAMQRGRYVPSSFPRDRLTHPMHTGVSATSSQAQGRKRSRSCEPGARRNGCHENGR